MVKDNYFYHVPLDSLKSAFCKGSEREIILEYILNFPFENTTIRLLDVGYGDGTATDNLAVEISKKYEIEIIGVDPYTDLSNNFKSLRVKPKKVYKKYIEDLNLKDKFNIINFRQSLYYVNDIRKIISQFSKENLKDGIIIITLWSENCMLYKLHKDICNVFALNCKLLTIEDIMKKFKNNKECHYDIEYFHSCINLETIKGSNEILRSTFDILSRLDISDIETSNTVYSHEKMLEIINRYSGIQPRVNGIIFLSKKSS